jgi:ABC-type sugar transport system substrate-binding protein
MQALRRLMVFGLLLLIAGFGFASGQGESGGAAEDDMQEVQPITQMTKQELLEFYDVLPFTDILPLEEGPIEIDGETPEIVIGFSQTGFNHPWRIAMLKSLQAEAARHSNVSLIVLDGNVDIAKQNDDVRDLLARGVDGVIMSPVESAGLVPAAREVMRRDLPLVVLDRDVPTEKTLFIGQSNVTMAEQVAQRMVEDLDGEGNIVVITGLLGSSPAVDRDKGMENIISQYPDINVLVKGDGEWIREPAVQLMEDWLTAYEDIDAVFSHAEESSWGAQLAIARAGRCDDGILHYTHDGSNAGFESVAEGTFQADGNYTPFIADIGLRAALYDMMGRDIPDKQEYEFPGYLLRLPDSPIVVPENADEWMGRGWGDFDPPVDPCQ